MKTLILRLISICLLSVVALTGCASRGSEFLGSWVNTANPNDTFQIVRNGDEYLIVSPDQKPGVGAIYKDGALEIKGALLSADLPTSNGLTPLWDRDFSARSNTSDRNERTGAAPAPALNLTGRVQAVNTP